MQDRPLTEKNDPPKDKTAIRIYMKSRVKVKKTVYDYELLSLLAEMGGYSGILLGISIVNLTSLISRVVDRLTEHYV